MSVKSPVRALRTKSEALMKSAADKPDIHVSVQNLAQPDIHVPSVADDDDTFPLINTQFLKEIDRNAQEKLNEASKGKEPRGFDYEPHPVFGFAMKGSLPSFDAITVGLPPRRHPRNAIPAIHNNHLDVIFYYLRKIGLYAKSAPVSDCGVFVASFAEHFILGHDITKKKFDVNSQRERYGYLLYTYGRMKHINECDSDDESPLSVPDEIRFGFMDTGKTL
ncbi:Unknown protein [Striga hermonthica]|uniref:Uncharacterized protein n=1 Tax=Striga hermonthica TaxID=68872 RepID=A0A9N7NGG2_STRHE|nr:Unknown protein [Striga hermonthica]